MKFLYTLLFLLLVNSSFANVVLPSVFADHMVLQQNDDVKIWGWANPNEDITIQPSWSNEVYKTKTNNQANWELTIKTPSYGGPYTITIKGYNEIILKDILIGEVWLCSGQSNMEMSASWGIKNMNEIEKANNPNIRFFNVPKVSAKSPQINVNANWLVSTPETMKNSSAVAYFFAKRLQEKYENIPVGLIVSAWGGTPAEIWMPEHIITKDSILNVAANKLKPVEWGPTEPARAFNAMINPLLGYNVTGALWYQGEANVGAKHYEKTLSALISSWRLLWNHNFPFYYVQIAPFEYGEDHFGAAEIRNAQRKVLDISENTGMVVIDDVSTTDDIHPKDKKTVGIRLANLALKNHYKNFEGTISGPLFKNVSFEKRKAIVFFDNSEGLYMKDNYSLFEISGDDKIFYNAKIKLKDDYIILSSKEVKQPKYVRFAWKNTAQSNVFNEANLPASTFTTEH
ncbi:sialate O-acetylesterase [Flaviramulus sp. BrNp1-15]|uniref:sialate O-acetylesterase n=1 Tax=Flaviramulus sp. BrNp1-15 TaxID=2916754 RepID=UPI001EE87269|nr:sialate O-acetylesterase [Flaviramulus sp. BrNp1-15]ULC60898.1 sialate O-acetylesterase [Flaviramulus sp. BrNp1-15]